MAVEIEVENITPYLEKWEPQVFLSRKYKSQPALPIRGGWGYSEADAVVIDRSRTPQQPTSSRSMASRLSTSSPGSACTRN